MIGYGHGVLRREERYTRTAIGLHWLVAAMVLAMLGIGWYMADLPEGALRSGLIQLHKTIGISIFLLMLFRLGWRFMFRPPPLVTPPPWQSKLARLNHGVLYFVLFVQPLSGYLSSSFSGYRTRYFGLGLPHWGWKDEGLNAIFNTIHQYSARVLALLILLHVFGALTHLLIYRDSVVRRMMPLGRQEGPA